MMLHWRNQCNRICRNPGQANGAQIGMFRRDGRDGVHGLVGEQLGGIGEGLAFERIAGRVEEKHGRLFADLALEPSCYIVHAPGAGGSRKIRLAQEWLLEAALLMQDDLAAAPVT